MRFVAGRRTCDGAAGIVAAAPFATQVADSSQQGEQVERVPSDRASEDTYEMSDDDYREDRSPSTSMTREYAI